MENLCTHAQRVTAPRVCSGALLPVVLTYRISLEYIIGSPGHLQCTAGNSGCLWMVDYGLIMVI